MRYLISSFVLFIVLSFLFLGLDYNIQSFDQKIISSQTEVYDTIEKYDEVQQKIHYSLLEGIQALKDDKLSIDEFYKVMKVLVKDISDNMNAFKNYTDKTDIAINVKVKTLEDKYIYLLSYVNRLLEKENVQKINKKLLYNKALYPSVRIKVYTEFKSSDKYDEDGNKTEEGKWVEMPYGTGSGTFIYSREKDGIVTTYVLSCGHLFDGIRETKTYRVKRFEINTFNYTGGTSKYNSKLVVHSNSNSGYDIMLLKMDNTKDIFPTATFLPKDQIPSLDIFDRILNVGAGIGIRPYPSFGYISGLYREGTGNEYLFQISAPGIYGNSGGGVFLKNGGKMIGILVQGGVSGGTLVTHQIFVVKPIIIWKFFEEQNYNFVLR